MVTEAQKCAIYARVSTDDQVAITQINELKAWAERRGWQIVKIYQENETAWKSGHQKEWSQLRTDARLRNFDCVLVWALDRVTRQGVSYLFQQIDALSRYGVKLISLQESWIESVGDFTEVYVAMAAFIAAYESKRRSERTLAGMKAAMAAGVHCGRPPGRKDSVKRLRSGQVLRREREHQKRKRGILV